MSDNPLDLPPLPTNIPWKRLCVSQDMIDTQGCDNAFPLKWKPSIALFAYEPPAEQQPYEDMLISYLKITCTLTGHPLGDEELSYMGLYHYWYSRSVDDFMLDKVNEYLACYGALLEVSVVPSDPAQRSSTANFPYFVDFQPKKRELYELVTQTGTSLSRSLEDVQIKNGLTSATNAEVLDNDTGIDWSSVGAVGGGIAGAAVTGGSPLGAAVGSVIGSELGGLLGGGDSPKSVNQPQQTNLRSTDSLTEKREELSHTTQLSQMYSLLTSYHLGTNRALFYMLPRPHMVQTVRTFVNGPRELEGIQEFLLVVMRPKSISGFCVDARLETAHIDFDKGAIASKSGYSFSDTPVPVYFPLGATPPTTTFKDTYSPPVGYEFDLSEASNGYQVVSKNPNNVTVDIKISAQDNLAAITVHIPAASTQPYGTFMSKAIYPLASVGVNFLLRKTGAPLEDIPQSLLILSREVCCCTPTNVPTIDYHTSIVYEAGVNSSAKALFAQEMPIEQANQLSVDIGRQMLASVGDPKRYTRGSVAPLEAQFLATAIANRIDSPNDPDNTTLADIVGLQAAVRDKILRIMPRVRRADVLRISLQEAQDRFALTPEEAKHLRRAALRLEEPELDPALRWLPPRLRIEREVPDVVGLSLGEAQAVLDGVDFTVGEVSYQDSPQPRDVILTQQPAANTRLRGEASVNLVVATGLSVRIPDVAEKPLSEALCMLRDAGLRSEPILSFARTNDVPPSSVIDVSPPTRTFVTPNAQVTLRVAQPAPRRPS